MANRRRRPTGRRQPSARREKIGAPISVAIESLSHDGRGIARVDGKAVFVWGALPGERAVVQRFKGSKAFDIAEVEELEAVAPERVTPPCPAFGRCGGCSIQHLESSQQIIYKQKVLADNLRRIGRLATDAPGLHWLAPLSSRSAGYRRRARFAVSLAKNGDVRVGFRERESNAVTPTTQCGVLMPPLDQLLTPLAGLILSLSIRAHIPQVEAAIGEAESGAVVALVFLVLKPLSGNDDQLLRSFAADHNLDVYIQVKGAAGSYPLTDARRLYFSISGSGSTSAKKIELDFQPTDFIQVNASLNDQMIERAMQLLDLKGHERVLDLFCGLGNFTLPLAQQAAVVVGVENDAGLIDRARDNAANNELHNATFITDDLFEITSNAVWLGQKFDAVLLDPPRAGAKEILPFLPKLGAKKIVYVSCHPGTLARDAGTLVNDLGYKLVAAGVMDMFPHTAHVESIALFERAG